MSPRRSGFAWPWAGWAGVSEGAEGEEDTVMSALRMGCLSTGYYRIPGRGEQVLVVPGTLPHRLGKTVFSGGSDGCFILSGLAGSGPVADPVPGWRRAARPEYFPWLGRDQARQWPRRSPGDAQPRPAESR